MPSTTVAYTGDDEQRFEGGSAKRTVSDLRTEFERDRNRIIHSAAFRRLQGKTQVYGLGASDYYRTRLTHSLEVAQIGKGVALRVGANTELVEAVCLAHDIGHPPFGHAGEIALHEHLCAKLGEKSEGFNGNAQNVRLLTYVEQKSNPYRGLDLTAATLDGLIKYDAVLAAPFDRPVAERSRKGYYRSDTERVKVLKLAPRKTFECDIMNWSDDVAYSSHDLEDALVIGTVTLEDLEARRDDIARRARLGYRSEDKGASSASPMVDPEIEAALSAISTCIHESLKAPSRIGVIKEFVAAHISDCICGVEAQENADAPSGRYSRSLEVPAELRKRVEIYKAVVFECAIMSYSVLSLQKSGEKIICNLFDQFFEWGTSDRAQEQLLNLFPRDWRREARSALDAWKDGERLPAQQLSRDFVTSMTDRAAEALWNRLTVPGNEGLFTARF